WDTREHKSLGERYIGTVPAANGPSPSPSFSPSSENRDDAPSGVVCLEISPDSLVLVASTSSGSLWSWNLQPLGEPEELARDEVLVTSLAFSPDGATLAAGNTEHKIDLWDFRARRRVGSLDGHDKAVTTIVFSPDGKALASDDAGYSTILWDVTEV